MDFSKNLRKCASSNGVDMNEVDECVNGNKGTELQLQAEKESEEIIRRSMFVPTVSTLDDLISILFFSLFLDCI